MCVRIVATVHIYLYIYGHIISQRAVSVFHYTDKHVLICQPLFRQNDLLHIFKFKLMKRETALPMLRYHTHD